MMVSLIPLKITKVIFTPEPKAPATCKSAEYFVNENNWSLAIKTATKKFKEDNDLYHHYKSVVATTVNVL
jgi:hypothetical protein